MGKKTTVIRSRLQEIGLKKVFRFQAIAMLGSLVNIAALWLAHGKLHIPLIIAGVIAIEIAIIHNFTWHYFVTWKDSVKHTVRNYFHLLIRYNLVTASIDFVANLGTLWILTHFLKVNYLLANFAGQLLGPLFKLLANEFLVFPKQKYNNTCFEAETELKDKI